MPNRKLIVEIAGDTSGLDRSFARATRSSSNFARSMERVGRGGLVATVGFRGLGRSVAFASGAFLGGAGIVAATKGAINAASDLNEQLNKTNVLFGQSAQSVKAWSRTTATSIGISQRAALGAAGGFASMLETAGLTQSRAAEFSKTLVNLAADMASFNNIDPSEALEKLRSGLAGEAEPLRTVGVLLSEARVKQEAYRSGLAKSGATLTEQQKVLARYSLILQDTAKQQGDFGRTSGGLANQQRILAAQVDNLQARLGKALLPDVLRVVTALNNWLSNTQNQARVQRDLAKAVDVAEQAFQGFMDVARPTVEIARQLTRALGGTRNAIELLIAAFVVSKVVTFSQALTGVGIQSVVATGRVNALRASLLRLGAIGVITVGVEAIINHRSIEKSVDEFLRGHHLGFLTRKKVELPATITIPDLQSARDRMAEFRGENDFLVESLDKTIVKLKQIDKERLRGVTRSLADMRKRITNLPNKTVRVATVEQGLSALEKRLAAIRDVRSVRYKILEEGVSELQRKLAGIKDKTVRVRIVTEGLKNIFDDLGGGTKSPGAGAVPSASAAFDQVGKAIKDRLAKDRARLQRLLEQASKDFATHMKGLGLKLQQAEISATLSDDLNVLREMERSIQRRIGQEGRTFALVEQLTEIRQQIASTTAQQASEAADRTRDAFQKIMDGLGLRLSKAEATASFRDDLAVLQEQLVAVRREIGIEGKTADLLQQRLEITQRIAETQEQIARAQADRRKAAQFKALGLTAEGGKRTPGVAALAGRLASLKDQVKGTFLDTDKTNSEFARIGKVLAQGPKKVGREVRQAILEMLNDISNALKGSGGGSGLRTLPRTRDVSGLFKNLGLDEDELKKVRREAARAFGLGRTGSSRVGGAFGAAMPASVSAGGNVTYILNNPSFNGVTDLASFQRQLDKRSQRTSRARSGSSAGRNIS